MLAPLGDSNDSMAKRFGALSDSLVDAYNVATKKNKILGAGAVQIDLKWDRIA